MQIGQLTYDQEISLHSRLRVDNDSLALLGDLDGGSLDWVLVTEQWCETRLDETGSESEDDQEDDEEGERGIRGDDSGDSRDTKGIVS
jgi:hypothetical protein